MKKFKLSQNWAVWLFFVGIIVLFVILKLIGFPEIMYK